MPIRDIVKDLDGPTLTVTADFPVPRERVWQIWSDPRQLERWWGPPTWPATFTDHDLAPGGRAAYYMTGPDGDQAHGWWRFVAVEPVDRLEIEDGFAHPDGTPNEEFPVTRFVVTFTETDGVTTMVNTSTFPSREAMEQMAAMGMEDGLREAMGQIDGLLAVPA